MTDKEKTIADLLVMLEETSKKIMNPISFMRNPRKDTEFMDAIELNGLIREELDELGYWDRFTTEEKK